MTKHNAIQTLKDHKICFEHDFGWNRTVLEALDIAIQALTADVVPVVRCGECRHWKRIRNGCILASCELDALVRSEDFFCADGERKDSDGE